MCERSEIRKKQHDFESIVHYFECRMVLFLHDMGEKSTLVNFFSPYNVEKDKTMAKGIN